MSGTPPPGTAGLQDGGLDAFDRTIRDAQAEIAAGIDRAGLRNDPYRYPLAALSTALGIFPAFLRHLRSAAERDRLPLNADDLARLETAAAGAARHVQDLARAQLRRTAFASGAILAAATISAAALAGVSGYRWGRSATIRQMRDTEAGLAAAFRDGPDAASQWLRLMRLNDLPRMMAACTGDRAFTDPSGRRACLAPIWLEEEKAAAPPSSLHSPPAGR